jgi:hypothetical protein
MSAPGPSRHIAPPHDLGRFGSKADVASSRQRLASPQIGKNSFANQRYRSPRRSPVVMTGADLILQQPIGRPLMGEHFASLSRSNAPCAKAWRRSVPRSSRQDQHGQLSIRARRSGLMAMTSIQLAPWQRRQIDCLAVVAGFPARELERLATLRRALRSVVIQQTHLIARTERQRIRQPQRLVGALHCS